jgi:putative transposase
MPEHVHLLLFPESPEYEIARIRTALKAPVTSKALRFLRRTGPDFLDKLKDAQPNGTVHYRFWQRGGGYDRNVVQPSTLPSMIDYLHHNPVRRGLVERPTDWVWSSARFYAGMRPVPLEMDPLPSLDG